MLVSNAQNSIGISEIKNFTKNDFKAGLQTWDITQANNGTLFMANNEGLLTFDGVFWNLFPLPNKTIVRSICIKDQRIYVGGQDEIGYFEPNANGALTYFSLNSRIPKSFIKFNDIWDICFKDNKIYFRSDDVIFLLENEKIQAIIPPTSFTYLGKANNRIYTADKQEGLLEVVGNRLSKATIFNRELGDGPVTGIIKLPFSDTLIVSTLSNGLYYFADRQLIPFPNNITALKQASIYNMTLANNQIVLATNENGVVIMDPKGQMIEQLNKSNGLQTNNCLSIFADKEMNIWIGLNNGIDFANISSSIRQIKPLSKDGAGYSATIYKDILFLATSDGVYQANINQGEKDLSYSKNEFKKVKNGGGQIWKVENVNNHLLVGKHEGVFEYINDELKPISTQTGYWSFISTTLPNKSLAGSYEGLQFINTANNTATIEQQFPEFKESSRYLCMDSIGNFWVSHPLHGLSKITSNKNQYKVSSFGMAKGLPSNSENYAFNIANKIMTATSKGLYTYDENSNRFSVDPVFKKLAGNLAIRFLKLDKDGNLWFVSEKQLGVIEQYFKNPKLIIVNELKEKILSGFESVETFDDQNILIGGIEGFYHLNFKKYRQKKNSITAVISRVNTTGTIDSIIYHGLSLSEKIGNPETMVLEKRLRSIRFQFGTSHFASLKNAEFSYKLDGLENKWSVWSKRTEKEYTNLKPGTYSFLVKARDSREQNPMITSFSFRISPFWHETTLAKIVYVLLALIALYYIRLWVRNKFLAQRQKHKEEQTRLRYIFQLEQDKKELEIRSLQNEKLASDIEHKNAELASSAMHLVKKGELMNKVQEQIMEIDKQMKNAQLTAATKKIISSLREDKHLDEDWEIFSNHFDTVHTDFTKHLKQAHPELTSNEIKLCINLRMNLSTKEIAQLMNISIRGVEVGRYRLRKKLGLTSETNFYDYLMKI